MAKTYMVSVPIAGTACIEVEADDEQEAIDLALETVEFRHIETWEALEQFNQGNVCYCPRPWEAEAELIDDGDAGE